MIHRKQIDSQPKTSRRTEKPPHTFHYHSPPPPPSTTYLHTHFITVILQFHTHPPQLANLPSDSLATCPSTLSFPSRHDPNVAIFHFIDQKPKNYYLKILGASERFCFRLFHLISQSQPDNL